MDRRTALAIINKATVTTTSAAGALVSPSRSRQFFEKVKTKTTFGRAIRQETRDAQSGQIDKITIGDRLIRRAVENDDDGYRAEPAFSSAPYQTVKVRLPWEVTNDLYRHNIEKGRLKARIVNLMARQWGRDLEDLEINGDAASGDPFLKINNGLIKLANTGGSGAHLIDGTAVSATFNKDVFFAAAQAMPDAYWADLGEGAGGGDTGLGSFDLVWYANPKRIIAWQEYLTDRNTAAGDAALGAGGDVANRPLAVPFVGVPKLPVNTMILAPPQNFVRVLTTEMIRYNVTANTDWELAVRDKEGHVYFLEHDFIVDEMDAVVLVSNLPAI